MDNTHKLYTELQKLSQNLWWAWNPEAQTIFQTLSPQLWKTTNHNPAAMLVEISKEEILARLGNPEFAKEVENVTKKFSSYIANKKTWSAENAKKIKNPIAYFSAEFGFHESVRTYSGGLGILAGDHTKSASDLGIPFVGVSLFYRQGYFEQRIAVDGWQQEHYVTADSHKQPIHLLTDKEGKPITCFVNIGFSKIHIVAWKLSVGRSEIILLDTNLPENEEHFRNITSHVYGGDIMTRISQEIVLGIGGVRMLRALGIQPSVYHMNEGHSAFLTLELLYEQHQKNIPLEKAINNIRQECIFTTHTPVPAGHDRFGRDIMEHTLGDMSFKLNISIDELMNLGRVQKDNQQETFCMTVLALKMSHKANGVSALHGEVSRDMWKEMYPNVSVEKVPIGSITNGIHVNGWLTKTTNNFWKKNLGENWDNVENFLNPKFWQKAAKSVSDEELWALRYELRRTLIEFSRKRLYQQHSRYGNGAAVYEHILNPNALTIGFARRFATYKRAPLLFSNFDRTLELFNDPQKPIQLIFAGKAHPRDDEGKKFIQRIQEISKHPLLFGKVIFLENYDMNVARHLISGTDVWLNNPRRPLEASGTSGQKVAIHGGLNCSIMDGWWREGYNGKNGWSIGGDESPESAEVQDQQDSENLYHVLKTEIIPEFYNRDKNNIPTQWLQRLRNAIATLVPQYNTHRMVAEYVKKYYV